jgi:hypothetical protein
VQSTTHNIKNNKEKLKSSEYRVQKEREQEREQEARRDCYNRLISIYT